MMFMSQNTRAQLEHGIIDAATQLADHWSSHDQSDGWRQEFHRLLFVLVVNVSALREHEGAEA